MLHFDAPIPISEFQNNFEVCNFIGQNIRKAHVCLYFKFGVSLKATE